MSCEQKEKAKEQVKLSSSELKAKLLKMNLDLLNNEDSLIDLYIDKKGWKMKKTGTGLRYMIVDTKYGESAQEGKKAIFTHTLTLMDGTLVSTSKESNPNSFLIGHGGVESGLEEGILFLKLGDKARFILPSHLAYGLSGNGQNIPAKSSLIYEIKLIDLE